jgi:outer membrane protein assembly factor BamB
MNYFKTFFALTSVFIVWTSAFADWPNWRGPNFNGSANDQYKQGYPVEFSPTKNVKWSVELEGPSASTPIVVGDHVFLSGTRLSSDSGLASALVALCIERSTGKVLWVKNSGSDYQPGSGDGSKLQLDSRSNYSSPSPVVNENYAVFFYGNGDLVCFDYNGKLVWRRNIQQDYGDFCFQWTFSSSPLLLNDRLFLPVLQRDEPVHNRGKEDAKSSILCIDLYNGKTIWRQIRETPAKKESRESFSTIIPHGDLLLVAGGDHLTAHNPKDGSEIWRWGTWNPGHKQEWWRLVPSPVVGNNRILVCAPKNAPVYAIDSSTKNEAKLTWDTSGIKEVTSDVPTPLFYDNYFYILSDLRKNLSKIEPHDGSLIWKVDLPGKYKWRASPSAADGKIYLMNHNAEVLVIDATKGEILHSVKMGDSYDDQTRSSIALSNGQIFIRTNKKLYCIQ